MSSSSSTKIIRNADSAFCGVVRVAVVCIRLWSLSQATYGGFTVIEQQRAEANYYTDTDIARLLGISLSRLRNKLTAGNPLPPRIEPPGCRQRLWPRAAVHEWLAQYTTTASAHAPDDGPAHPRGPTTKKEARGRGA